MQVVALTNATELEGWIAPWEDLWRRARGSAFQHPGWIVPWSRRLMRGPMCWLAAGDDRGLACVVPLFPWITDMGRTLSLIGQGVSDYLGELADPVRGSIGLRLVSDHLVERAGEWNAWDFQRLREGSPLVGMPLPAGWSDETRADLACPVVEVPPGASRVEEVVPAGMAARIRRQRKRAGRLGTLTSVVYEGARATDGLRILWELHQARWRSRGQRGVLDAELEPFHRESVGWLGRRGIATVHVVELEGVPIGALYALSAHGETACYLQGISPEHQDLSPGTLAIASVIDWAARAGMRTIDMLRGQEAYKYDWGARDRNTVRRVARRRERGIDAIGP